MDAVNETAGVIVVGAGVQGASIAFHLARRGVSVLVLERGTVAAGATGRSSGFVRMHYDLESESRLAWASYPYFRDWAERVGAGDCGFVRTGFVMLVTGALADHLRANVAMHQRIGVRSRVVGPDEVAGLVPGMVADDIVAAAYEPESGYADPTGTAAGAWAAELAATVGLEVPVRAWRHDTAYFGLPAGRTTDFPIVIDDVNQSYFRPEGRELMLVGLEAGNVVGGSPDRPLAPLRPEIQEAMVARVCARVPWMAGGTFRTAHGGQDGITPDQRAIIEAAGPDGFYLACGFSGTGFKTSPAVGACVAELILDGRATTVDISAYTHRRFAEGRTLVGEHPYGSLWR